MKFSAVCVATALLLPTSAVVAFQPIYRPAFLPVSAQAPSTTSLKLYAEDVMDRTITRNGNGNDNDSVDVQKKHEYLIDTSDKNCQFNKDFEPPFELIQGWTADYLQRMEAAGGVTHVVEDLLTDDHVQTGPNIGPINKPDLLELCSFYNENGMDIGNHAVTDFKVHASGWHVDPHNPWRVWVVVRYEGAHTGTVQLPPFQQISLSPEGDGTHKFMTGPELQSFLWTPKQQIQWKTVGGVGDPYTGSNEGMADVDGVLVSIGMPRLVLAGWKPVRKVSNWISQFRGRRKKTDDAFVEPRKQSPYSELPQWWHHRKTTENFNSHM